MIDNRKYKTNQPENVKERLRTNICIWIRKEYMKFLNRLLT